MQHTPQALYNKAGIRTPTSRHLPRFHAIASEAHGTPGVPNLAKSAAAEHLASQ